MKKIILIFLFFITQSLYGQNYPIKTKLKKDSVVILSVDQYEVMQTLLENQKQRVANYKRENSKKDKEIEIFVNALVRKNFMIDSLLYELKNKNSIYDSLKTKLDTVEKWIYNSSIDNTYLYYSYREQQVIGIDFGSYMVIGNRKTGNFSLVRMGTTEKDEEWKKYHRLQLDEPPENWDTFYKKKYKPNLIKFPYKIKI